MKRSGKSCFVVAVVLVSLLGSAAGQRQDRTRSSAWEALLKADPSAVDDPTVGWRERLILHVLTPEQARAYFRDQAEPESLLLENGQTLREYLDARLSPPAGVFVALPTPCELFRSDDMEANQRYSLQVRGKDLSAQGGSVTGCAIPAEATAVMLLLRLDEVGGPARVKLWAADGPEPAESVVGTSGGPWPRGHSTTAVRLATETESEGELLLLSSDPASVAGSVIGYFRATQAGNSPGGDVGFYVEGSNNNLFGTGAGESITTGVYNSFFGANAGHSNTEGHYNSFFGGYAGYANTTGNYNSFFGDAAGRNNTTGSNNAFFGRYAGYSNTSGTENSALGQGALQTNTTGVRNTAVGRYALQANLNGDWNTALGAHSLAANTTGYRNTAVGDDTLAQNTTGYHNTAIGENALYSNLDGVENTGLGKDTLFSNTSGDYNTAAGEDALFKNTSGSLNTGVGEGTLQENTSGSENTGIGQNALHANTTGHENTAVGQNALANNTAGIKNTAVGDGALNQSTGDRNTSVGEDSMVYSTSGTGNTALGWLAGLSNTVESGNTFIGADSDGVAGMTNATAIGYQAMVSQSNSLVLGSIAGVNDAPSSVSVGIGTATPTASLHVVRSDGTGMVKVEETSGATANRVLFRLTNNGAPWFKLLNSATAQEWTFAMDQFDNFIFSRIGTGGSEFKILKSGEVIMGPGGTSAFDLKPTGDLIIAGNLTAGGVTYVSDRNRKTNFTSVDSREILDKVASLEITRWNFTEDQKETPHLGPMAQDFHAAFGLGDNEKSISAADISGVALAAIQGLHQELQAKEERIQKLETQMAEMESLKAGLRELRALLPAVSPVRKMGTGSAE